MAIITIVVLYSLRTLVGGIGCINDFSWLQCVSSLVPAIFTACHSSLINAVYPKCLAISATISNFAESKHIDDEKRIKDCAVECIGIGDSRRCVSVDGVWGAD